MKRIIQHDLERWRTNQRRKPLLIRGARQVGKTYIVRKLGENFDHYVEINFELLKDARAIFQSDLQPDRITRDLALLTRKKIIPGKTLVFFDEIQEAPEALTSLRYFYEMMPELHLIAAGSLLEFQIEKTGIPVGRITTLYMYPLSFSEFLTACGNGDYIAAIKDCFSTMRINEAVHNQIMKLMGEYIAIGGLPEVVNCWEETKDYYECLKVLRGLAETYRQDFGKYAKKHQIKYVDKLFNEVPSHMSKKFKFTNLSGSFRKRELSPAIDLLSMAGVIHKIYHSSGQGVPIGSGVKYDHFKLIFFDIALSQAILNIEMSPWILNPLDQIINKGIIAEAFVGQEFIANLSKDIKAQLYYWHREARSSNAEIDYLVFDNGQIIPVEVKSGKEGRLKSMQMFFKHHPQTPYGVRYYGGLPQKTDKIHSFPLYCAIAGVQKSASNI